MELVFQYPLQPLAIQFQLKTAAIVNNVSLDIHYLEALVKHVPQARTRIVCNAMQMLIKLDCNALNVKMDM